MLVDYNISKDTLIIAVETSVWSVKNYDNFECNSYIRTVLAAMLIQMVSRSPDPPRYLRAMTVAVEKQATSAV